MSPLPTIVNNYNLSSMFHKTMSMTQKKRIAYGYSNRSEEPSRRTLSRQAARKCMGKGMSRHRSHPRATLSTDTHLQSLRKDILRQHLAKFHYVDPVRPTLYILNDKPRNHLPTYPVILNLFHLLPYHHVIQNRFYPYVCNCRARMFASEVTTQHNGQLRF